MDPNVNILQVDLTNAFGMAERGPALDLVAEHFPDIYNWCQRSYGGETVMMFGKETIYSTKGWHQGDPLAPLLFSLGLVRLTHSIQEQVEGLRLHVWFLDDGHIGGSVEQLTEVARIISEEGPELGLHVSRGPGGKSKL